jgi:hypothetical protein
LRRGRTIARRGGAGEAKATTIPKTQQACGESARFVFEFRGGRAFYAPGNGRKPGSCATFYEIWNARSCGCAWTIHNANHLRAEEDAIKVGGHQASSASLVSIMTALYFGVLRPQDRVAVKPHASPVFHAIQYLLGNQTRDKLEAFRAFGGAQSYPSRTKDTDDVDISTGSVGLGVAMTLFASWCRTM